jgi:hypothetical protein
MTYRSKAEKEFADVLADAKINFAYEPDRIPYVVHKKYLPDFYLVDYGFYIEFKGYFRSSDRSKHILIKEQHPHIDIRFIFMRANQKIYPTSKTSYGEWCDKHGFEWAENKIPDEWLTKKKKVEDKVKKVSKDKMIPLVMQRSYDDHHLSQPYSMFFFRFNWPPDVREFTGKRERWKSLHTHDLLDARLMRDELLIECKLLVHKVRTNEQSRRKKENIRSI